MIITLCGSTKFKDKFMEVMKELTLQGHIVIPPGCFGHLDPDPRITINKKMLDQLHKRKIDISDAIYVINVNGYLGKSTEGEVKYAKNKNKKIIFLEPLRKKEAKNEEKD
ncbi:MAG TPA: hypothetical protein ENI52_03570 [Thermoplasmata archaeon]|nr:hypothetical protein [Thermoplasmata archaeon]